MKKYGILLVCMVFSLAAMSQKAVIDFEVLNHDFGKVNEADGKITHVFDFTNKGNTPLVVNRVQASCGCTTPTWTKEPIEPGKKGSITVTYNPAGRPGAFTKTITVYSNASNEQVVLIIKGEVNPSSKAEPKSSYAVDMNGLSLNSKIIQMNNIDKGKTQVRALEIKNSTNSNIKPTFEILPPYLTAKVTPEILGPNTEGKITFTFDSNKCPTWGPVKDDLSLLINGQKSKKRENVLTVYGNIVEDFSKMTLDQKRKSPILEIPEKTINLGVVKSGQKRNGNFKIFNKGQNSLEIRRIINTNLEINTRQNSISIGSKKAGLISFDLNSKNLPEGSYKKTITLQSNDFENSFLILVINYTIKN